MRMWNRLYFALNPLSKSKHTRSIHTVTFARRKERARGVEQEREEPSKERGCGTIEG